ncbi:hypothetical protein AVEN_73881-1, partial [Araneus ventricosus]
MCRINSSSIEAGVLTAITDHGPAPYYLCDYPRVIGVLPVIAEGPNPLSGSVFFLKRFEKRAAAEPLSILKVSSSQQKIFPKAQQNKSLPPPLSTVDNQP